MGEFVLDFERPIKELQKKIDEMKIYSAETNVELSEEIHRLEAKLQKLSTDTYSRLTRWQRYQLSKHPDRPYTLDYIPRIFTEFIELHGDRLYGDDPALVGGLAKLDGRSVIVMGQQKGRTTKEKLHRNFGMMNPEGYRKALRLMKMAAKFNKPVIAFIDTPGAYPGLGAEERGQGEAIARNLFEMSHLPVPVICVVIGEGASGGALGIGVGDRILMMENSWYSVISPEACAAILWKENPEQMSETAAEILKITAPDLQELGIIDEIVPEPQGGAHLNADEAASILKRRIVHHLESIASLESPVLVEQRIQKYSSIGFYQE